MKQIDLTFVAPDNISPDFCQRMIDKFESDPRKHQGATSRGVDVSIKDSQDLLITRFVDWEEIVEQLDITLRENMVEYQKLLDEITPNKFNIMDTWHNGYQIQKSGHYKWHHDASVEFGRQRVLTFIWYLNTMDEGGETGFLHKKVKPETGKFIFFPATWNYIHCGFPANNKYIITGWLWADL
jgi:hypothetical protein